MSASIYFFSPPTSPGWEKANQGRQHSTPSFAFQVSLLPVIHLTAIISTLHRLSVVPSRAPQGNEQYPWERAGWVLKDGGSDTERGRPLERDYMMTSHGFSDPRFTCTVRHFKIQIFSIQRQHKWPHQTNWDQWMCVNLLNVQSVSVGLFVCCFCRDNWAVI